jgi:hypothetical protein
MGFIHVYSSINQPTWKSLEAKQGSMGQMKGWFIISQSLWGTWMKWNPQWSGLVEELLKSQSNVPNSNGFEPVHKNNTTHLVSTFFFLEQTETGLPATSLRVLHHFNSILLGYPRRTTSLCLEEMCLGEGWYTPSYRVANQHIQLLDYEQRARACCNRYMQ